MVLPKIVPVLPSADIDRDRRWYESALGIHCSFCNNMYAVLESGGLEIHLQWHADTEDDPLLGGSVIKLFDVDVDEWYKRIMHLGIAQVNHSPRLTNWGTYEFGLYDLNLNAIFFCVDAKKKP